LFYNAGQTLLDILRRCLIVSSTYPREADRIIIAVEFPGGRQVMRFIIKIVIRLVTEMRKGNLGELHDGSQKRHKAREEVSDQTPHLLIICENDTR
jgi:hypothetical protein